MLSHGMERVQQEGAHAPCCFPCQGRCCRHWLRPPHTTDQPPMQQQLAVPGSKLFLLFRMISAALVCGCCCVRPVHCSWSDRHPAHTRTSSRARSSAARRSARARSFLARVACNHVDRCWTSCLRVG
jgi:hypothetical protein